MGSMASQITSLTIVYSAVYSGADQRKHQSPASLAFMRGIHMSPVNSPHKWPVTRKMFPFDDVIMESCKTTFCQMFSAIDYLWYVFANQIPLCKIADEITPNLAALQVLTFWRYSDEVTNRTSMLLAWLLFEGSTLVISTVLAQYGSVINPETSSRLSISVLCISSHENNNYIFIKH